MMFNHDFIVFRRNGSGDYKFESTVSDPYKNERVRRNDQMLCQTLDKIFAEYRLRSVQMEELLRAPAHTTQNFISMLIPELEPGLRDLFPKNNKFSLVWFAILCCYQESAELLVRSGADVNELYGRHEYDTRSLNEKSSLLHALLVMYPSSWNERFIRLLIERGANLQARDSHDRTALHVGVRKSRVQAIQLLLEKGAEVNPGKDKTGATPLSAAAVNSEADLMMPLLIKYGADVTFKNRHGGNLLHCLATAACSAPREHAELARFLVEKGVSIEDRDTESQFQPIHEAIWRGKNEMVKVLLDLGADVNALSEDGEFPLFLAAERDHPEVILTLLKRGANINQKTSYGCTALHVACQVSRQSSGEEHIKILLSNGADMFAKDNYNVTPFILTELGATGNRNVQMMLKTMAIKDFCLPPPIDAKIELIEKKRLLLIKYYEDCQAQISRAKSTRYADTCTFFELLTKCQCQIAKFMRNIEFKNHFEKYDLSAFSYYADDIREAFKRAERYYDLMDKQEDVIVDNVTDILPPAIVTKIACYVIKCDMCKIKRIVQASATKQ